jgi:endo-1,4-beta-D-glucanase Y
MRARFPFELTFLSVLPGLMACTAEQQTATPQTASGGTTASQSSTVGGSSSPNNSSSSPTGGTTSQTTSATGSSARGGTAPVSGGSNSGGTTTNTGSGGKNVGGANASGGISGGGSSKGGTSAGATGGSAQGGNASGGSGNATLLGGSSSGGQSSGTASGGTSRSSGGTNPSGGTSSPGGSMGVGGSNTQSTSTTAATLHGCTVDIPEATLNKEYSDWLKAYVVDCPPSQARVQAGGSASGSQSSETFSEGIGYGMLLAVSFNDRTTFDKLWAYYKANLDPKGLMNWKMNACTGNYYEANGASDGDLDTAMALVLGDKRWGTYSSDANTLLDAIHKNETMPCGDKTVLRPGDAWGLDCNTGNLNPSYFAPGYYRAFAQYQSSQSAFWSKFADDTIALLLTYQKSATSGALMGEWAYVDKLADTNYGYNACRTPWRVAVDYVWWGTEDAKTYLTNVSKYVDSKGGVASVPFDMNSAFLGPFALSGIATDKCAAYYQSWMTGSKYDDRYFQGTLRVLAMLVMAGKFTF